MPGKTKSDLESEIQIPDYIRSSDLLPLFESWKYLRKGVSMLKAASGKERQDIQHRVVDLWTVVFALQVELFDEKRINPYFVYTRLSESIGDLISLGGELGIHREVGVEGLEALKAFKPSVSRYREKALEATI